MTLQTNIIASDTFSYQLDAKYDGFTYNLAMRGAGTIDLTAVDNGDGSQTFTVLPAVTSLWTAGLYNFSIYADDGTNSYSIETGQTTITLRADLTSPTDVRTHAQIVLDSIEAVIENRATKDQEAYSIGGRSLSRTPIEQLLKLRGLYRKEVKTEQGTFRTKLNIQMSG